MLSEASEVTLTISDATGRETPLLRSAWFPAGEHEIAWDAAIIRAVCICAVYLRRRERYGSGWLC